MKSAWLTDIDIRAGVAPPTTTVPWTPDATEAGGLDTGGEETGGDDTGRRSSTPDWTRGGDDPGLAGGRLNACGLLTPPGAALDPVGD